MQRIGAHRIAGALAAALALAGVGATDARAQQYGERVGNSYLPSTHDANCGGLLCNSLPVDPARPSQALAPPPCQGVLCGLTPYSMQRPYTASEAAAAEQQRAAAQAAAAAAPPPEPTTPVRHLRKHRKKVRAAAAAPAAAARTPAPAPAAAAQ